MEWPDLEANNSNSICTPGQEVTEPCQDNSSLATMLMDSIVATTNNKEQTT